MHKKADECTIKIKQFNVLNGEGITGKASN